MSDEILLTGGRSTAEVVRIGDTIHRSVGENAEFVHRLLTLLQEKEYPYAPRFLGIDDKGREILSYIDGEVPKNHRWTMKQMLVVVDMMKDFHDATAGTPLADSAETICHCDIAPWNVVMRDDHPVAFIDFDGAVPGQRVDDLAYFLWTFLDLGSDIPIATQVRRIRKICRAYGYNDGVELVTAILRQQNLILEMRMNLAQTEKRKDYRDFSAERLPIIQQESAWIKKHSEAIEKAL